MNFKANITGGLVAGGLASGGTLSMGYNFDVALMSFGCCVMGALFPDLDVASIPARWFGRVGLALAFILLSMGVMLESMKFLLYGALPGIMALICLSVKHRGPFHKYWVPVALMLLAVFGVFPAQEVRPLLYSFAAGIIVHLMLDGIFVWNIRKGWFI